MLRRCRVFLAAGLGLCAGLSILWGLAAQAQGDTVPYSTQVLGGPATLPADTFAGPCKPWVQVNDGAFGLGDPSVQSPPYLNEDGFEVAVFDGSLYVGMEADDQYGARVWRTRPDVRVAPGQGDWQQVVDDAFGDVNNNDHIDSLEVLGGYLYASTAQGGSAHTTTQGTEVWRTDDGVHWTQVNVDGFGTAANNNFKDLARFIAGDIVYLCGGTANSTTGAQVWCTSGAVQGAEPDWSQVNADGFGAPDVVKVWSTAVFSGYLYAGTERSGAGGIVWRSAGAAGVDDWTWEAVYTAPVDSRADIVGVFSDTIYIGFEVPGSGTQVYRSADGTAWIPAMTDGFGDARNERVIVDAATVYNGALYLATLQAPDIGGGAQVWRTTDGVNWTNVMTGGWGSATTFAAELIPFNGYLYAWASDYHSGQKVLRTACPICQARPITGTGRVDFPGVGAALTLTVEHLDVVTVCVYPGAPPVEGGMDGLAARHYEISAWPPDGAFLADVTLSYDEGELTAEPVASGGTLPLARAGSYEGQFAGGAAREETLHLAHWDGDGWRDCPVEKRTVDAGANAVTCRDVTAFSTWAIAGEGEAPTGVDMLGLGTMSWWLAGLLFLTVAVAVAGISLIGARRRGV